MSKIEIFISYHIYDNLSILHSIDLDLSFMNFTIYIFDQLFSAIFRKSFIIVIYCHRYLLLLFLYYHF